MGAEPARLAADHRLSRLPRRRAGRADHAGLDAPHPPLLRCTPTRSRSPPSTPLHRESARTPTLHLTTSHTPPRGSRADLRRCASPTPPPRSPGRPANANSGALVGYLLFEDGQPERVVRRPDRHGHARLRAPLHVHRARAGLLRLPQRARARSRRSSPPTRRPPRRPVCTATEVTPSSGHARLVALHAGQRHDRRLPRVPRRNPRRPGLDAPGITLSSLAPSTQLRDHRRRRRLARRDQRPHRAAGARNRRSRRPRTATSQAFLLASTDQSFFDLEAHYQQIGVVYPTYFNCGAGGAVTGNNEPLVTGWARGAPDRRDAAPELPEPRRRGTDPQRTGRRAEAMIEPARVAVRERRLPGHPDRLRGCRHRPSANPSPRGSPRSPRGCTRRATNSRRSSPPSTTTSPRGRAAMYNDAALSVPSDYVFVLDWGLHWTTSTPGRAGRTAVVHEGRRLHRDDAQQEQVRPRDADVRDRLAQRRRLLQPRHAAGVQQRHRLGGRVGATARMGTHGAPNPTSPTPTPSGVPHTVWYTDQQSLARRAPSSPNRSASGIGLWHLGSEDQSHLGTAAAGRLMGAPDGCAPWRGVRVTAIGAGAGDRRCVRLPRACARWAAQQSAGVPAHGRRPTRFGRPADPRSAQSASIYPDLRFEATRARSAANGRVRAERWWAAASPEVDAYARRTGIVEMPRFTCQEGAVVHRILTAARRCARARSHSSSRSPSNPVLRGPQPRPRERRRPRPRRAQRRSCRRSRGACTPSTAGSPSTWSASPRTGSPARRRLLRRPRALRQRRHRLRDGLGRPLGRLRPRARSRRSPSCAASPATSPRCPTPRASCSGCRCTGSTGPSPARSSPRRRPPRCSTRASLALAQSAGATPVRDPASGEMTFAYTRAGVSHRVWYLDAHAILDRLRIARQYGLAAGVWRLGEEDQALWSSPEG